MKVTAESAIKEYKRIEAELSTQEFTVNDAKRMLEKLSETFADKSVGDMWSMGFLTTMRVTDILDLLNSQKAEIENKNVEIDILIRKKKTLRDEISELSAEIERLQHKISELQHEILNCKSEAIKEFAEKYEKAILPLLTSVTLEKKEGIYACLDTLKEMVGDSE